MRFISKIALGLAAATLLASCAAATDSTSKPAASTTTTTKKLMVDVPKSLTTKATSTASIARAAAAVAVAPASIGYSVIQSTVDTAKVFIPFMAQYSTLIDAVISQNNLSTSSATVTGKSLTITQAMLDSMKASVDADMFDASSLPKVGDSMPMPDFVYNTSSNSNFNYSFALSDTSMSMTFYWNTDSSKFGMQMTMSGMTMTVANDSATASTVMKIVSGTSVFTMKFKADSAATATEGVYVGMDSTTPALAVVGWADNNGGAVSFASSGSTYTEEFTGAGAMSYQAYDAGAGAGTTVIYGTAVTAAYTAKLGNTAWGNATTFFP